MARREPWRRLTRVDVYLRSIAWRKREHPVTDPVGPENAARIGVSMLDASWRDPGWPVPAVGMRELKTREAGVGVGRSLCWR